MSDGEAYDMEESFLYPINYNFLLSYIGIFQWMSCTYIGAWGIFWYNDGGEMIQDCFSVGLKGGMASFFG
jgi:hypothetical protein